MISRWKWREPQPARHLSTWAIVLGAVIVLGIGVAAFTVLLWRYGGLDAIRTASAITVAAGGAAALLLVARRQRSTELTLEHQREVALAAERDAAEQRITELYAHAVDQLGAEKAPVRLGGLHALERLAQNNPPQRQTIVDVICAYLRMPYTPPDDQVPSEEAPEDAHSRYEQRRQELQVRLTAQRILTAHLNPEAAASFWADIDLNLTEAHLHQLDLDACHIRRAQFDGATFAGWYARFRGATFAGDAGFGETEFAGTAEFQGAKFTGTAWFRDAKFAEYARFGEADFAGAAEFGRAEFARAAEFNRAEFARDAQFSGAMFAEIAWFDAATFAETTWFQGAEFAGKTLFCHVKFTEYAQFGGATFAGTMWFNGAEFIGNVNFGGGRVAPHARGFLPTGWIARPAVVGEEYGWLYMVRDEDSSEQPAEAPGDGPA